MEFFATPPSGVAHAAFFFSDTHDTLMPRKLDRYAFFESGVIDVAIGNAPTGSCLTVPVFRLAMTASSVIVFGATTVLPSWLVQCACGCGVMPLSGSAWMR